MPGVAMVPKVPRVTLGLKGGSPSGYFLASERGSANWQLVNERLLCRLVTSDYRLN